MGRRASGPEANLNWMGKDSGNKSVWDGLEELLQKVGTWWFEAVVSC